MTPWAVLLRVALILVLVLNGAGAAAASVAMPRSVAATSVLQVALPAAKVDCHQVTMDSDQLHAAAQPVLAAAHHDHQAADSADCCAPQDCPGHCMHGLHAMASAVISIDLYLLRVDAPVGKLTSRAETALSQRIRPPIG